MVGDEKNYIRDGEVEFYPLPYNFNWTNGFYSVTFP
jgi:hypothetical protein